MTEAYGNKMKIILIFLSALSACASAFMFVFFFLMLNGGGLGRSSMTEVSIFTTYGLLNIVVVVSLLNGNTRWKSLFYILGIIDCLLGTSVIIPKPIEPFAVMLGLIIFLKGYLAISSARHMATKQPI